MDGSRIAATAGVLLAGVGLLVGCAGPSQPTGVGETTAVPATAASTAAPAPASPAAPAPAGGGEERPPDVVTSDPRCAPAQLEGRMEPGDPGAGHRAATLVVTNTSTNTCTLYGYGGAELYTASGVPIPTRLTRLPDPAPALVRLLPGSSARKDLRWTVVPTGDEPVDEPCQVPASQLRVIPPDETSPFSVIWDLGPVCDGGRLDGSAFYAG
ncbi:DUF4232 domain-containing protein [Pseudonocardia adelaidensis]|uniref:DUF4232 domain-containing protein n=1 Tax=Pseudonocardia adelaidensis TaxID=648754 RepID=A0ABP9NQE5_9PSEU